MNVSALKVGGFMELNEKIRSADSDVHITDCCGQRFMGTALAKGKKLTITGTPGNAAGAYLNGGVIEVIGNVQDAVGDTMNLGKIIVHGNAGDALGYAMRGGNIFIRGNAGYRAGVHMKAYKDLKPVIVIGGSAGSFLGEYLAGGLLVVLGIGAEETLPVGNFIGTGMHGGEIFIRTKKKIADLPAQVAVNAATQDDLARIKPHIMEFAELFEVELESLLEDNYYILTPNTQNPYHLMYVAN
ncbi:MAG: glutamate synthase [Oscillospiraceae bacterium]|nr:glutamate synthase [Oscillospiraceae bacterium]